jgi:hypothetical protein
MNNSGNRCYSEMVGDVNAVGPDRTWKFTTKNFVVRAVTIQRRT